MNRGSRLFSIDDICNRHSPPFAAHYFCSPVHALSRSAGRRFPCPPLARRFTRTGEREVPGGRREGERRRRSRGRISDRRHQLTILLLPGEPSRTAERQVLDPEERREGHRGRIVWSANAGLSAGSRQIRVIGIKQREGKKDGEKSSEKGWPEGRGCATTGGR